MDVSGFSGLTLDMLLFIIQNNNNNNNDNDFGSVQGNSNDVNVINDYMVRNIYLQKMLYQNIIMITTFSIRNK